MQELQVVFDELLSLTQCADKSHRELARGECMQSPLGNWPGECMHADPVVIRSSYMVYIHLCGLVYTGVCM